MINIGVINIYILNFLFLLEFLKFGLKRIS